jgi:hypothetical protein
MVVQTRDSLTGEVSPPQTIRPATQPNVDEAVKRHKEAADLHRQAATSHRSGIRNAANPEGHNQYTHTVTTHTPVVSFTSSVHNSEDEAHAAAQAGYAKSGYPHSVEKVGRKVGERSVRLKMYGQKVKTAGGPGSGVRGHTTDHEAAAKLHLAAASAHETAMTAHEKAHDAGSHDYESQVSKDALAASRTAHELSMKAQNETESFAGDSPRSEAQDAKGSSKRALQHAKAHENEEAASVHADAIFSHQQAAKQHYKAAGLRMAGGPGSGVAGHTTPHDAAIKLHETAILAHHAAAAAHRAASPQGRMPEGITFYDSPKGKAAADATNHAYDETVQASYAHEQAVGEDQSSDNNVTNVARAINHAEDATYKEGHAGAASSHDRAAKAHEKAILDLRKAAAKAPRATSRTQVRAAYAALRSSLEVVH